MIEIVYTPNDKGKSNDVIKLPKNIKQVGNIKDSRKIYIEDYAINHINEAHDGNGERVVGVLLGVAQKSGADRYIFVKGAITVPDVFISESEIAISENDWSYIYEIAGKYFPSLDVLGWFVSLDGVNSGMMRTLQKVHTTHFAGGEKVLFIFDRQERGRDFFAYENNQLIKQSGYTIYYERNEEMQEYMVDMRNGKRIEVSVTDFGTEKDKNMAAGNVASFRNMVTDNEQPKPVSRKQSFVNYCANVALVVLVLFVGMYVMDEKDSVGDTFDVYENATSSITQVVKVDGHVYPTSAAETMSSTNVTDSAATSGAVDTTVAMEMLGETGAQTEKPTQAAMETQPTTSAQARVQQETTAGYLTVNTKVTQAAPTFVEHTVKKGENLISICKSYYGSTARVAEIMEINDIEDMDKIYIGQVIKLP